MSINDLEFLYGAAFLRLLKGTFYIFTSYLSYIHSSLYTIKSSNQESAILFKISKKSLHKIGISKCGVDFNATNCDRSRSATIEVADV